MPSNQKFQIVVFISGRGSNLQAIAQAIKEHSLPIEITLVLSDKPSAKGLQIAESFNIPTVVIPRKAKSRSAEEFSQALIDAAEAHNPRLIVLAGFMRVLGNKFVSHFKNRIINIHPSLLPAFRGLAAQEQALNAGVKFAGCTVHYVTEEVDAGPIIAQAAVPVMPDDSVESLESRILKQEHIIYPAAIEAIAAGKIKPGNTPTNLPISNKELQSLDTLPAISSITPSWSQSK